jgi:MoaA/NifB/PqqE/SkfB family radical SAM enzyme
MYSGTVSAPTRRSSSPVGEASHRSKGLIRLTMACNERCPFCNVPMENYKGRMNTPEGQLQAQLEEFASSGEQTLTISGGEPTLLQPRLLWLIRAARERLIPFIDLQTNAILIDDNYAKELADAGLTSAFVSLLSHRSDLHDELAGKPGAYLPCLRGIDALVAHGIDVTLNPVTTRQTQELLPEYVDFVAARLPTVKMISVSAVQPHGRAAENTDLLPDYEVLAPHIREARRRAFQLDIELVNPYCGLPPCVGWEDDLSRCVEAEEAKYRQKSGPNLSNKGNKSHGAPCARCAIKPWCGGVWHAYWDQRGGRGIEAPQTVVPPWLNRSLRARYQQIVPAHGTASESFEMTLDPSPTHWLWTDSFTHADIRHFLRSDYTELALDVEAKAFADVNELVRATRQLAQALRPILNRPRLWLGLRRVESKWSHCIRAISLAQAIGFDEVAILTDDPRRNDFYTAARERFPSLRLSMPNPENIRRLG